jgi:transcriptional regulator with XRE-family HTH domain
MRGMTTRLTIGERVAWYRRRRGLSQLALAGLVGRTEDWVSKVENNRIDLDRLSVIRSLAEALDVSLGDLLAEPSLMAWTADSGRRTVPALRRALMDYHQLVGSANGGAPDAPEPPDALWRGVGELWGAYQDSRFGYVTAVLPRVLARAQRSAEANDGRPRSEALAVLALAYQAASTTLTKVGETDLAWIASDRGLAAATAAGNPLVLGSLYRSVAHALLSNGRYEEAIGVVRLSADRLRGELDRPDPVALSVYGSAFLAGAMAAARADDRAACQDFLGEAQRIAQRLGHDGNHLWTAFGPTNVAIHRVATAVELGDVQVAVDLGPRINTAALPLERRIRHELEVARALASWGRRDEGLTALLAAEHRAPEQVRYHFISRQLVLGWMRSGRSKPSHHLTGLAQRIGVA